jgi:hypothetical protein
MSTFCGVRFSRLVALVTVALMWSAIALPAASANPERIRVNVDGPVKVGSTVPVTVEFLNRDFRPEKNDRERLVRLEMLKTGGSREGRGRIAPNMVKASAGVPTIWARFTAEAAGTVRVRVTSDGLAPGEAVIRITSGSSALLELFAPTLHAQPSPFFELLPRNHKPFPRNGLSTAQFSIHVDSPADGKGLSWVVQTDPAVKIKYGEKVSPGAALITIEPGRYLSEPFEILEPSQSGPVRIRAQAKPTGRTDEVEVQFVAPRPVRVSFAPQFYKARSNDQILPVHLVLVDKDGIALRDLDEPRQITLRSAGRSTEFKPATVTLSGNDAQCTSNVHLPWFRFGREMKVLAEGEKLLTGEADVTVTATEFAMILVAIVGGLVGGLGRHVYVVQTAPVPARRTRKRLGSVLLDPVLLRKVFLGVLAGVIVFLAADYGITHNFRGVDHGSPWFGLFLAVVGGFGGGQALDAVTELVLKLKARSRPI